MANNFTLKKIKAIQSLKDAKPLISSMKTLKQTSAQKALLNIMKHDNIDIRVQGLKALGAVADKTALPALITALEKAKDPVMGSEEAMIHETYLQNICKTISEITGKKYQIENVNDVRQVDGLIKELKAAYLNT